MNTDQIFRNNKKWISKQLELDENYFENLSREQTPEFLYIGCSDSRVPAEALMGVQPGEVFVHRNMANLVPNTDLNVMAVINYAVDHLKVSHIIVCGHYYCGGIKSAMQASDLGILNPWLRNIRDVYRLHNSELNKIEDAEVKNKRLVELNVQEQCGNVIKTAVVQRAIKERGIQVHGWVFDIHTGQLIDLKINFHEMLKEFMEIYRLKE